MGARTQPFSSALRSLEEALKPIGGLVWPRIPTASAHASEDAQTLSGVAAEKTGDLSITYESAAARIEANNTNVREVIYNYLSGTGLLYRGVSE